MQADLHRHIMKSDGNWLGNFGLAAWVLLAVPVCFLLFLAEQSETSDRQSARRPYEARAHSLADGEGHGKRARQGTEENWSEVEEFMRLHSRRKWAAYEKLPENGRPSKTELRAQLIARYNELNRLGNKDLRDIEVDRVQIEDDIFGALSQIKRAKSPVEAEKHRPEYLAAVARLIENRMAEHKARLANLRVIVGTLENQVSKDESIKNNPTEFKERVADRARVIETKGLGPAAGPRRRLPGQPATSGPEDEPTEVLPTNP